MPGLVPGRTGEKRIGRWLAEMEAEAEAFADEKGRDGFAFDPIESRYLEAGRSDLRFERHIRAPPLTRAGMLIGVSGECRIARSKNSGGGGRQ